ncbi:MAG: hypothetical protein QM766_07490 [Burkholderiaceae bacterium]
MSAAREHRLSVRKPAAVLLAVYAIVVVAGIYPYLRFPGSIGLFQILQIAIDLLVVHGLYGYATRRRIRGIRWRVLYLVLALVLCVRVAVVLYLLLPNLFPWFGTGEQLVSLIGFSLLPVMLLAAYALWRHAMTVSVAGTVARPIDDPSDRT